MARVHGGARNLPVDLSKKEAMRFPNAVLDEAPAISPVRRRSSGGGGRGGLTVALRAKGGEKARVRGGRRACPAPLFIGEAW